MLQLSEACNILKYVRALTWQIPEQSWNRTLEIGKESLALFARNEKLMMTYRRSDSLHIVGYSDSDYAGDDRKSTSGYVFTISQGELFYGKAQSKPSLHRP